MEIKKEIRLNDIFDKGNYQLSFKIKETDENQISFNLKLYTHKDGYYIPYTQSNNGLLCPLGYYGNVEQESVIYQTLNVEKHEINVNKNKLTTFFKTLYQNKDESFSIKADLTNRRYNERNLFKYCVPNQSFS